MKPLTLIILWLIVVLLFSAFGFFGPGSEGQIDGEPFDFRVAGETVLFFGGIGFTIATCLVAGLFAVGKSRVGSMTKVWGIGFVLFWSAIAAVIPPAAVDWSGLYHGESAMEIVFQAVITVGIGISAFIAFAVAIFCVHQSHAE
jgi:hypothetical protein